MDRASNLLSVGHSHLLSVNPLKGNLWSIFCIFLLTCCSSAYIPSAKNVPLFENKGESLIETGASTNSFYLNGSYAFSEKYAVIANGSISYPALVGKPIIKYNELTIFREGNVQHYSFETGIGRYNLLPPSNRRLEVFAGAGYGLKKSFWNNNNEQNYFQGFVQANIGKKYKHSEIGWSLRTAYSGFQYQHGYYKSQFDENGIYQGSQLILEHESYQTFHLEPLFVIRVGGQQLRWFARAGFNLAFPLSSTSLIETLGVDKGYTIFHFSTGLSFRF